MMPGGPERRSHDYVRHGTTDLFAAYGIADGTVISELRRHHRAAEFKKFLARIDKAVPRRPGRAPGLPQPGHPQGSGHPGLAGPPPPVLPALHADRLVVNQPGRTLVRVSDRPKGSAAACTRACRPLEADIRAWIEHWNQDPPALQLA
jgi:hypothetical protein